jgi:formylglycine-generating enzyme required for sulfatase activity
MRTRLLVAASLLLLGCPPPAQNPPSPTGGTTPDGDGTRGLTITSRTQPEAPLEYGAYHALVVGNNDYQHHPKLKTAVHDAETVAAVLREDYAFDVKLMTDVTSDQLEKQLWSYRNSLSKSDNLLIYYAGHGYQDPDSKESYWLPVDADDTPADWVSNATIATVLKTILAKHVMLVSDSCYSGSLTRGIQIKNESADYFAKMAAKKARVVLTSGGLEPVSDDGGGANSVFARQFIDALRGNEGVLDGHALFSEIRRPIMLAADQTPEYGDIRKCGHDGGDFLFVRAGATAAASESVVSVATPTPHPTPKTPVAPTAAEPVDPELAAMEKKLAEIEARKAQEKKAAAAAAKKEELRRKLAAYAAEEEAKNKAAEAEAEAAQAEVAAEKAVAAALAKRKALEAKWGPSPSGFTPVREETFACGGQRNAVKIYRSEAFAKALGLAAGSTNVAVEFVRTPGQSPFLVARTEVTQAVWEGVMGQNPSHFKGASKPVEKVSWNDAQAFCKKTGLRLPTEAEWERACRGGTTTEYCFADADGDLGRYAWFESNAASKTHDVGTKLPNAFGLFDVHGNVWEWTESQYSAGASKRVRRGGCWNRSARYCRSANRDRYTPGNRNTYLGFRPARSLR